MFELHIVWANGSEVRTKHPDKDDAMMTLQKVYGVDPTKPAPNNLIWSIYDENERANHFAWDDGDVVRLPREE
jgi:hypothetical protein